MRRSRSTRVCATSTHPPHMFLCFDCIEFASVPRSRRLCVFLRSLLSPDALAVVNNLAVGALQGRLPQVDRAAGHWLVRLQQPAGTAPAAWSPPSHPAQRKFMPLLSAG
eukprot:781385-Pleurochrysis_carterae.AAC.1